MFEVSYKGNKKLWRNVKIEAAHVFLGLKQKHSELQQLYNRVNVHRWHY